MIGLVRMHLYRGGVFWLLDVPRNEAKSQRLIRAREGWICTHTEEV